MASGTVILNGERREIELGTDLGRLVEMLDLPKQRIAVELNGAVIRRSDWLGTTVNDGDKIEVVQFVGGG